MSPVDTAVSELAAPEPAPEPPRAPVVIVGAGLAGLTVALHLADRHPVVVLAKRDFDEAATAWAQGGIVGVLGDDDSVELHVRDTQEAGAGLVDEHAARVHRRAQRRRRSSGWSSRACRSRRTPTARSACT